MLLTMSLVTDLEINTVKDLYKQKPLMEGTAVKINVSEIARQLKIDRRTVLKYVDGFEKSKSRKRKNAITDFNKIITAVQDKFIGKIPTGSDCYMKVAHSVLEEFH